MKLQKSFLPPKKYRPFRHSISLRIMGSQNCFFGDPIPNPAENRSKLLCFGGSQLILRADEKLGIHLEPQTTIINGCFNWMMIPNLYIENGWKSPNIHPFINGWPWGSRHILRDQPRVMTRLSPRSKPPRFPPRQP